MQQGPFMDYKLTIKEISIPDKECPTCLLTAFKFIVIDENGNPWFGSDDRAVVEEYINCHKI